MKDIVRPPSAEDYTEALESLFDKEAVRHAGFLERQAVLEKSRATMQMNAVRGWSASPVDVQNVEDEYWKLAGKIREVDEFADDLLDLIGKLEDGMFEEVENRLRQLFPELQPPEEKLSKRKKAIMEANDGVLPNWIDHMLEATIAGPAGTRRITTGRRATKVTGIIDPYSAEQVFHEATADTHGGKVRGGSKFGKGRFYVDSKGRRKNKR